MTPEQIQSFMKKAAEKKGWKLTPDTELIGYLKEGFAVNLERYGYLQCPCREGSDDREWDKDILCPCEYAPADVEEYGQCFCGLYLSQEVFNQGGAGGSIPERRPEEKFFKD